jgi:(R,R)-butanediol dehydrogenase/meso-butanediol dehydrogenase/diacetyl reductase
MRAAVYHGPLDLRIEDRPAPTAGPGEVLIRVSVCGVCGTDAAEYRTGPHLYWTGDAHPVSGHSGPLVPGHELVGRVEAIGRDVEGLREGDLVASGAGVWCGHCRACDADRTNLCERYWTVGLQRDGGLAELVAVPASTCVDIGPYGLTEDAAGLAQPMAIAAHAIERGDPRPGEDVLVIGTGGIGGFITYAASRSGAHVIASEADPGRRETASRFGAAETLAPAGSDESPARAIADLVFEVSGTPTGLAAAIAGVRRGGRIVVAGMHEPTAIDLRALNVDEVTLIGTVAHRCAVDLPAALRLLAERSEGWADVASIAIPLEGVVEDGLDPLWNRTSPQIKTLVDPRIATARPTVMSKPAAVTAG